LVTMRLKVQGSKVIGSSPSLITAAASLIEKETNERRTWNVQ
jgi:hypothetical protein